MSNEDERLQAICDLAAARLASLDAIEAHAEIADPEGEMKNIRHDLKEIVRTTGKVWMLCRKHVTPRGRTCVKERGHEGPCVGC
jgi:hypothetical protein